MPIIPIPANDLTVLLSDISGGKGLKLSANEIIKGLVLDNIDTSTVLLRVKGNDITAHITPETSASLSKGAEVLLKVTSISPSIVLNLVNDIPQKSSENILLEKISTLLMERLPNKEDLGSLITDIFNTLHLNEADIEGIAGKELISRMKEGIDSAVFKGSNDESALKDTIKNSGLLFESKIAGALEGNIPQSMIKTALHKDLKAIVIDIITKFKNHAEAEDMGNTNISTKSDSIVSNPKDSFEKGIKLLLDNIEIDQISNFMSKDSNSVSLNIPFLDNRKIGNAKIFIKNNGFKKGTGGTATKENYMVVFFLAMTRLGDMRIDLYANNNIINCAFKMSDKEGLAFIKRCSEELLNSLKDKNVSLSFEADENIDKEREGFEKDSSVSGTGIVDILI